MEIDLLVLPVHRGGDFLKNALASLEPVIHKFRHVIISLNSGDNSPDLETIRTSSVDLYPNVQVVETPRVFPAAKHLKHIAIEYVRSQHQPSETMMLFFHDDVLDSERFLQFLQMQKSLEGWAFFGGWRLSVDGVESGTSELKIMPGGESATDWIDREETAPSPLHSYTNASGLIFPVASFLSYSHWVPRTRGVRLEYMLATHRSVRRIGTIPDPFIIISRHPMQEGANATKFVWLSDEVLYQLWLFINFRRAGLRSVIRGIRYILLASGSLVFQTLKAASPRHRNN